MGVGWGGKNDFRKQPGPHWANSGSPEEARRGPREDQKTQESSEGREKTKTNEPYHTQNICVSNKAIGSEHWKITHKSVH